MSDNVLSKDRPSKDSTEQTCSCFFNDKTHSSSPDLFVNEGER